MANALDYSVSGFSSLPNYIWNFNKKTVVCFRDQRRRQNNSIWNFHRRTICYKGQGVSGWKTCKRSCGGCQVALNNKFLKYQVKELQKIGYCPQFDAYLLDLTGREVLSILAALYGYKHPARFRLYFVLLIFRIFTIKKMYPNSSLVFNTCQNLEFRQNLIRILP